MGTSNSRFSSLNTLNTFDGCLRDNQNVLTASLKVSNTSTRAREMKAL
jgi:hypothetical protein